MERMDRKLSFKLLLRYSTVLQLMFAHIFVNKLFKDLVSFGFASAATAELYSIL